MAQSAAELLAASAWKLHQAGKLEQAIEIYRQAAAMAPDYAEIHNNLGNALRLAGRAGDALTSLRRAAKLKPTMATVHSNLGLALADLGRFEEAAASHRHALTLQPALAMAHNNLGTALLAQGKYADAGACYRRAVELQPDFAEAYGNLGDASRRLERFDEAAASFRRARALKPDFGQALAQYTFMQRTMCDWRDPAPALEDFVEAAHSEEKGALAFAFLAISDDPALQLLMARHDSRTLGGTDSPPMWQGQRYEHAKIRLAYLSADYHEHATAYLIAELLERHDRSRFELHGISFGPSDNSAMQRRVRKAFDRFVDVARLSDEEAAKLIRGSEIDIAVDLKGLTREARPRILGHRPAPVQVNYLGYPGSMGADFIDYVIVDPFVVPPQQQVNFTEKLVHLPECYQVNDSHRAIAERTPSRAECGLPKEAFVFCCFNHNYKLTPAFFDIWMRLLTAIPGSVLWLFSDNRWAVDNLRREALARGVDPDRLIFAPRIKLPDHLARHRLADLFLDTLPVNAHTTASDALWAGLPILTCAGNSFAGRVAGSLLHAMGAPELVAHSLEEYEDIALKLAREPGSLASLKEKLAANRMSAPLFDTGRFRRHIEAAYAKMWSIWQQGQRPTAFAIKPIDEVI